MDKLVTCRRCGSNACYEQEVSENVQTWLCLGCGFTTSTLMTENSELVKGTLESSPELYRNLVSKDSQDLVWMPATVTLPEKGMVFIDGVSEKDWRWAAVKAVPILKEEQHKYPSGQTYKMDMKNVQYFHQRDFMDALEIIGFYNM